MSIAKMWQLVMPGSHDSFAYKFKNHIPPIIRNLVQTQNLTITEQLKMGIRTFDLRVCGYRTSITAKLTYYTAHTYLCQPLDEVLAQLKDFIETHPTEIISISIRNDNFTINFDANTGSKEVVQQLDIKDKYYREDIFKYVFDFFGGTDLFIRDINDDTTVKELQ